MSKPTSYVVRSFDDFKALVEAGMVNGVEDVNRIIKETYPDGGLREKQIKNGFYPYIGCNLRRYAYHDKVAAQLHAVKDMMDNRIGHSYGFPFEPRVETHKKDGEPDFYEVWTG